MPSCLKNPGYSWKNSKLIVMSHSTGLEIPNIFIKAERSFINTTKVTNTKYVHTRFKSFKEIQNSSLTWE